MTTFTCIHCGLPIILTQYWYEEKGGKEYWTHSYGMMCENGSFTTATPGTRVDDLIDLYYETRK